jgi:hypothetical protein
MKSHRQRVQRSFVLEPLEGRLALSGMGGLHHAGQAAEVHGGKHGADDPANHNANDDKVAKTAAVQQHHGGKVEVVHHGRRGGAEHPAGHK